MNAFASFVLLFSTTVTANAWRYTGSQGQCNCSSTSFSKCVDELASQSCKVLKFAGNAVQGTIPSSIGSLTGVTAVDIFNCDLTGTIPPSLGSLGNGTLTRLNLENGQLTGVLPGNLLPSPTLHMLNINNQQLTGSIPTTWFEDSSPLLTNLTLNTQRLAGTIPNTLSASTLPKLLRFSVASNVLSGTMPSSLGSLSTLQYFSISNNILSGAIPDSFSSLTSARYFYVGDNMISGTWPDFICDLPLASTDGSACSLQPGFLECPMPTSCSDYKTRCDLECQYYPE
mmetsp:Transcript_50252/g.74600  ORF Transcript_50252/g.74600 Transcript_50252/m.74600 type:complete len:285 (+) Transcript_50252:92-946(+)